MKRGKKKPQGRIRGWITDSINHLIDSTSLLISLIVQLWLSIVTFSALVVLQIEKIAAIGIGVVMVLGASRAWKKFLRHGFRNVSGSLAFVNWIAFALVTLFLSMSYMLVSTENQSRIESIVITVENDPTLSGLIAERETALTRRDSLVQDFDQSVRAETVDSILIERKENEASIVRLNEKIFDRRTEIETGQATERARGQASSLDSEKIFNAIPNAFNQGRHIALIIFFLAFTALELTINTNLKEDSLEDQKIEISAHQGLVLKDLDRSIETYQIKDSKITEVNPKLKDLIGKSVDPNPIDEYARVRFRYPQGQSMPDRDATLKEAKISASKYQRITQEALDRGLLIAENGSTSPAPFITKELFISEMKKDKPTGFDNV